MARGQYRKPIPLLVNGSIDTKTNPKLVAPGSLLELQNMYQLKTGEMRPRNGFAKLSAPTYSLAGGASNLFATQNGGLGTIGVLGIAFEMNVQALRYGNQVSGRAGWGANAETAATSIPLLAYPNVTAALEGLPTGVNASGGASNPVNDPDMCIVGGERHTAWTDGFSTKIYSDLRDISDARQLSTNANLQPTTAAVRPPLVAGSATGTWAALFYSSAANTLNAVAHNPVSGATTTLAIAADLAALPYFDAKAIPGTSNFAVAYKALAGGIKCGIYNPSASTFTAVVATAGADATFCLGWLDDSFATGTMYLATAGSVSGVVVREMAAASMVVSATRTIDAGATANVRNITGHLYGTAAAKYIVLWDVAGATTIADGTKLGGWDGAAAAAGNWVGGPHTLYSRSVKFLDNKYRVLGCFDSPVQPMFSLFLCDALGNGMPTSVGAQCHVLQGEASSRRSVCSLTTPVVSNGAVVMALARERSITLPDGSKAAPNITASLASFKIMTQVTNAREVGNTVFLPGGQISRDDGATYGPATFSIYPEAPTGVPSAIGGAMTAGGAYSYRILFRKTDAAGRAIWSAGSIPLAVTLGGADNRVTLAVWGLSLVPADFGFTPVAAEIYRRGPAATGATLYNKVGEVRADSTPAAPTISFVDGMSDANAALGQVAYFNGNVLENFNPPAHTVLEVNGDRVGIINAEDPTEFWFSKEYKAGTGIGFHPQNKVAISGDGAGGMTALAAMDGRWILFKRSAIYVLSGDGPNDLGQGSFNRPQEVSRIIGTINPASVILTPDGIMFQSQGGNFWLLDRGLQLQMIGAPVEEFTDKQPTVVVGAALVANQTLVRFPLSGESCRILEWDYFHKRWYVHVMLGAGASDVVGCANSTLYGWCYMLSDGRVFVEGVDAADNDGSQVAIVPIVSFPHLQLAGLAGYQRLQAIEFTIEALANCTVSVDAEFDFSGALTGTPKTIAVTPGTWQIEYNPPEGMAKNTAVRPVITLATGAVNGSFKLTGAVAYVSIKRGTSVTSGQRMT